MQSPSQRIRIAVLGADLSGKTFLLSKLAPSTLVESKGLVVSTAVVPATNAEGQTFFVELVEVPCPTITNSALASGGATADVLLRQRFAGAIVLVDGLSSACYAEAAKYTRLLLDYQRPLGNADLPLLVLANLSGGGRDDFSAVLAKLSGRAPSSSLLDWLLGDEGGAGGTSSGGNVVTQATPDFKSALATFVEVGLSSASSFSSFPPSPSVPLHLVRLQPGIAPSLAARFKRRGGGAAGKRLSSTAAGGIGSSGAAGSGGGGLLDLIKQCCRIPSGPTSRAARARLGDDDDDEAANALNDEQYWWEWKEEHAGEEKEDGGAPNSGHSGESSAEGAGPTLQPAVAFGGPATGTDPSTAAATGRRLSLGSSTSASANGSIKKKTGPPKRRRVLRSFPVAFAPLYRDAVPSSAVDTLVEAAIRHLEAKTGKEMS